MLPPTTIDGLRAAFREAYEEYVCAGYEMRDLLANSDDLTAPERVESIKVRQKRVDETKLKYETARAAYVTYVLGTLVGSGGTLL